MNWFIRTKLRRTCTEISHLNFWIVPGLNIWYRKHYFLETCVYTPAFGVEVHWLIFHFSFLIQKGYE